jgi:hypothetical protein
LGIRSTTIETNRLAVETCVSRAVRGAGGSADASLFHHDKSRHGQRGKPQYGGRRTRTTLRRTGGNGELVGIAQNIGRRVGELTQLPQCAGGFGRKSNAVLLGAELVVHQPAGDGYGAMTVPANHIVVLDTFSITFAYLYPT